MKTKLCSYCKSDIPEEALKCKYCMEWVADSIDPKKIEQIQQIDNEKMYSGSKRTLQEIASNIFPFNKYVNVLIVTSILFGLVQYTWSYLNEEPIYIYAILLFAIQGIITWGGIVWFKESFINYFPVFQNLTQEDDVITEAIYRQSFTNMFSIKKVLFIGLIVGAIASIGDYVMGTPFKSEGGKITYAIFEFFVSFWAGAALVTIYYFSNFIRRLGRLPMDENFKYDEKYGVSLVGRLHLKTILLAITPYILGIGARMIGDWEWHLGNYLWFGGFGLIIILYIYWPLFNIHLIMDDDKENQLDKIRAQLKVASFEATSHPSSLNLNRFFELTQLENSLKDKPTWPFDTKNIIGVFLAVIFPLIMMIIDRLI